MITSDPYCTRSDVTRRLPPGSLMALAGLVASSPATTNTITYDGHGLETDDPVTVRAIEGGTLSAPLVEGTTYYVRRLTNETFELAATPGGAILDLTTDAISMVVARDPDFGMFIEFYSRWIDMSLPAHVVPLGRTEPVHPLIRGLTADLVAKRMFNVSGQASETLKDLELATLAQLARFSAGLSLRGAASSSPANKAVTLTLMGSALDPRGWGTGNLP